MLKEIVTVAMTAIITTHCLASKASTIGADSNISPPPSAGMKLTLDNAFSVGFGSRNQGIPEWSPSDKRAKIWLPDSDHNPYISFGFSPISIGKNGRAGIEISAGNLPDRQRNYSEFSDSKSPKVRISPDIGLFATAKYNLGDRASLFAKVGSSEMTTTRMLSTEQNTVDRHWVPSAGLGVDYKLTDHVALRAEYQANIAKIPFDTNGVKLAYPSSISSGLQFSF